jgi:hypothetical protein
MFVLEFETLAEYVDHLRERQVGMTHLALTSTDSRPDAGGARDVTFHAVASRVMNSARSPDEDTPAEYIVLWRTALLHTDSVRQDIRVDHHDGMPPTTPRATVREDLARLGAELETAGLRVQPGRWLGGTTDYRNQELGRK